MYRKREHALTGEFGMRKCSGRKTEGRISRLQVNGAGIVNYGFNVAGRELGCQCVAIRGVHDKLMIDTLAARIVHGDFDTRAGK